MQQLEHMRGELNDYAKGLRAQVHVRSNTMGISVFLPTRLARFLSAHPNIDVDLEEGRSRDIVRAVAAGKVEIGIVAEGLEAAAELETMPVGEYRFVLVVPLRHELARCRKLPFKEVLDYNLVGLRADTAWQDFLNEQATRAGKRLKLRVRLDGAAAPVPAREPRRLRSGAASARLPAPFALTAPARSCIHVRS